MILVQRQACHMHLLHCEPWMRFNFVNFAKLTTHGSTFSCGSLPISNCKVFATNLFAPEDTRTHTGVTEIVIQSSIYLENVQALRDQKHQIQN